MLSFHVALLCCAHCKSLVELCRVLFSQGIGIIEKIISIVQFVKLRKTLRVASEVDGAESARVLWEKDDDKAPYCCGERPAKREPVGAAETTELA